MEPLPTFLSLPTGAVGSCMFGLRVVRCVVAVGRTAEAGISLLASSGTLRTHFFSYTCVVGAFRKNVVCVWFPPPFHTLPVLLSRLLRVEYYTPKHSTPPLVFTPPSTRAPPPPQPPDPATESQSRPPATLKTECPWAPPERSCSSSLLPRTCVYLYARVHVITA